VDAAYHTGGETTADRVRGVSWEGSRPTLAAWARRRSFWGEPGKADPPGSGLGAAAEVRSETFPGRQSLCAGCLQAWSITGPGSLRKNSQTEKHRLLQNRC